MNELQEKKRKQRRANGQGSLIKLNGCRFWYAQYYDQMGRKIRVSTKTDVKQEAQNKLTGMIADAQRGLAPIADAHKLTYADLRAGLLASYVEKGNKSLKQRANGEETVNGLAQLDQFFGFGPGNRGPRIIRINTETGRAFVKARQAEGAGNAVINRSLACLRRMLRLAFEEKKIQSVPVIRFLKEPPARRGFLELPKFEELLAQFQPTLKPYITFLYFCGGRRGEAELIEWPQVHLERKLIRIEDDQTKDKEAREIPLPGRLVLMLERIEPKQGLVFDTTNLRKEWRKACAAVGLGNIIEVPGRKYDPRYEGLTLHDFRRSAIRNLVTLAGVREKVAMEITGHKTRSVFDRYHIVDTTDVSNAMQQWETKAKNLLPQARRAKLGKIAHRSTRKSLMALSSRG
jgi:integrase